MSKKKTPTAWLETVRRMATMDDANIAAADIVPIAAFLAAKDQPPATKVDGSDQSPDSEETDEPEAESSLLDSLSDAGATGSGLSTSAAFSTLWRGGDDSLENPNFFADVWLSADWQPDGPLRAKATACTSCHSDRSGGSGFTLEMVEAYAAVDLLSLAGHCPKPQNKCDPSLDLELKAGRFIVPFGAFSGVIHPGAYRTVTVPLMYNMGRQVYPTNSRPPVLPMPYSDEGVDIRTKFEIDDFKATLDVYGVNGLQGFGPGVQFTPSRSYADNNTDVSFGTRATVGNDIVRCGGSVMSGRMQNEGSPNLNYHLSGFDASFNTCDNMVRGSFEYAIRRNDSIFGPRQISYGTTTDLDVLLWENPNIRVHTRYDTLEHRDFAGEEGIRRFTWGFSTTILAGSTLIIDHEHWRFSERGPNTNILGLRWLAVF
ncbi:MAG: hypothetical protein KDB00_21045 [Planctomycetales bacterium]|nr:hypothetical protein [Planctomycetales bacterium]